MRYVLHILSALLLLSAPELGWESPWEVPVLVALLVPVPYLLATGLERLLRGRVRRGRLKFAIGLERLLVVSPLLLQAVAVGGLGWVETVSRWTGSEARTWGWPDLTPLLGIVPFVVFQLAAIDAHVRLVHGRTGAVRPQRAFHVRMFLSSLLPVALFFVAADLTGRAEALRIRLEEVALFGVAFTVLFLAFLVPVAPFLLRGVFDTTPLPAGSDRDVLEEVARRTDFEFRELVLWRTGRQVANAAVIGFGAFHRQVLFSDALLDRLGPAELGAVFGHEIGHAKKHHALTYVALVSSLLFGGDLLLSWSGLEAPLPLLGLALVLTGVGAAAFAYLARRFELEADLVSRAACGSSAPLIRALSSVTPPGESERHSWGHFSPAHRVRFLAAVERDPRIGRGLVRRLSWVRRGTGLLFVIVLALQARELVRDLPEDLVYADLRLGRYEEARDRLAGREESDEELARLLALAAELPEAERSPALLEERAKEAVGRGELVLGTSLVELAILRGRQDLVVVRDVLQAALRAAADDPESARGRTPPPDLPDDLPGDWRARLARGLARPQ